MLTGKKIDTLIKLNEDKYIASEHLNCLGYYNKMS
jgi:hypothetical protein